MVNSIGVNFQNFNYNASSVCLLQSKINKEVLIKIANIVLPILAICFAVWCVYDSYKLNKEVKEITKETEKAMKSMENIVGKNEKAAES